jgi:RND family efflux transporter MFP subunit
LKPPYLTRWIFGLTVFSAGLLMPGCKSEPVRGASAPPAIPVTITTVKAEEVPVTADFAAQTYARNTVDVRGRVAGYVEKWLFRPGSEVKQGQVLYELDVRPYRASVEQARGSLRQSEADLQFAKQQVALLQAQANLAVAQSALVKARQDYERVKPLVEADASSKQDLDAATAALAAAEANVNANKANVEQAGLSTKTQIDANAGKVEALKGALTNAELNLDYAVIRAPISGRIGDSLTPVGGLVTPTSPQPLTTIVPLDPVWVRFKVTESDYLRWSAHGGTPSNVPITLLLADGTEYAEKGRIENTLNQIDPRTGTLELQARFPNPHRTLLPGLFGRVRVQVDKRSNALSVPQKSVQQLQSLQSVYVVDSQNKVQTRVVTPGPRVGENWLIEKGLNPGDRVIVDGLLRVRPGAVVAPTPYKAD